MSQVDVKTIAHVGGFTLALLMVWTAPSLAYPRTTQLSKHSKMSRLAESLIK
jgi:hypothetical protein